MLNKKENSILYNKIIVNVVYFQNNKKERRIIMKGKVSKGHPIVFSIML
jgi:hypothetical protein